MDTAARVRELADAARAVGAVRVRLGDLELELGPLPVDSPAPADVPMAATRERILFPSGRARLPMGA